MNTTTGQGPATGLDVVTLGEVIEMFVADNPSPLEREKEWTLALAGAETNVAIGLARLGHRVVWIGAEPLGRFAVAELTAARGEHVAG